MNKKNMANIMLLGRTGTGKSSFINYLLDVQSAPTGCGAPVTKAFDEYVYSLKTGFPVRIFDSKGLEVDGYNDAADAIVSFAKDKCDNDSITEWIHAIFYCININRTRLEPEEEQFIKTLQEATSQTIHIIITHCRNAAHNSDELAMIERIKNDLGASVNVYCVNSVEERKRTGETLQQFGKESIIKNLVGLLWDNTVWRISTEYAAQLRSGLFKLIDGIKKEQLDQIDSRLWANLVRGKVPEISLDKSAEATIRFIDDMNVRYEEKIQAFLDMYCSFANAFGAQQIKLCAPYTFSYNVLLNDSLDDELKKWHAAKEKEIQEKAKLKGLEAVKDNIEYCTNIRDRYKEPAIVICKAMKARVPSKEQIEQDVYAMLLHAKEQNLQHSPTVRLTRKISPNELCPCGSGKKFKKCCKGKGIFD